MKPWIKILIGIGLGVLVGVALNREIEFFRLAGKAFLDLLRMLVGIIVFTSMVSGICHLNDPKKLGRIGGRTILFYVVTTLIAISFGVLLALAIKPGAVITKTYIATSITSEKIGFSVMDFIFSIVPSNPFAAFAEGNMMQIIVFSILFALAITISKEKGRAVLHVIESISEVMYTLTHMVMKLAPYGIFALMAATMGKIDFWDAAKTFGLYLGCNFAACLLQIGLVFCFTIRYMAKLEVGPFFKGMKEAIALAFSSSSSSATLPVSIECTRDHLGVSADIAGFVMSLGSTINMNGTAIAQAIAAIFIAQAYGIEITAVKIVILFITALLSAVGAAGIPGTGLIMLAVVLNAMGLPTEGIAIIYGIDRIREMGSSVVNVLGDAAAAVYVAKKEKQIDEEQYHKVTWLD